MTYFFVQTILATKYVQLLENDRILGEVTWDAQGAEADHLLPAMVDLLAKHGYEWSTIHGILVLEGPGSFTGLRITLAVVSTLHFVHPTIKMVGATIGEVVAHVHHAPLLFQPYPSDYFLFDAQGALAQRVSAAEISLLDIPPHTLGVGIQLLETVHPIDSRDLFPPSALHAFMQTHHGKDVLVPFYAKQPNISQAKRQVHSPKS